MGLWGFFALFKVNALNGDPEGSRPICSSISAFPTSSMARQYRRGWITASKQNSESVSPYENCWPSTVQMEKLYASGSTYKPNMFNHQWIRIQRGRKIFESLSVMSFSYHDNIGYLEKSWNVIRKMTLRDMRRIMEDFHKIFAKFSEAGANSNIVERRTTKTSSIETKIRFIQTKKEDKKIKRNRRKECRRTQSFQRQVYESKRVEEYCFRTRPSKNQQCSILEQQRRKNHRKRSEGEGRRKGR